MINVTLLSHTAFPEETVARAGRLCYFNAAIADLEKEVPGKKAAAMISKLLGSGHLSALEHASFTFGVEGISRACSHQLVRHRIASYSQQSQRYVAMGDTFGYITPQSVKKSVKLRKKFDQIIESSKKAYSELIEAGIPKEDARYVLPNAAETRIIITMNARELIHFFTLRTCRRAQWEIRGLAKLMLKKARETAPAFFDTAGPACLRGKCPEGRMSCGRQKEVKKEMESL